MSLWFSRITFLGIALCLGAGASQALELESYPDARVMYQSTEPVQDYVLALGSYKKAAGSSWLPEREERLQGRLTRYTLELPAGHTPERAYSFYLQQLQGRGLRELYHCVARDCGTSNSWANNHFRVLQLYGLDQFQQYGAYEVDAESAPVYVSLYVVQRGNRRVYMQVELLRTQGSASSGVATSPESIAKALLSQGFYVFPEMRVEAGTAQFKPAHVNALAELLALQPRWKLALVGHDYSPLALAQQQALSLAYSEQLWALLKTREIGDAKPALYGLGGLAPAGRAGLSARLEVVKLAD